MPDLTIGAMFPLSGPLSSDVGRQCVEAVRVATEWFAPPGWNIRVVAGDPSSLENATTEAERLIRDEGALLLCGSLRSDLALRESEVAERMGALFWGVAGTAADEITTRGLRHTFRLSASASNCYSRAALDPLGGVLAPGWGLAPADLPVAAAVEDVAFPQSWAREAVRIANERGFPTVGTFLCNDATEDLSRQVEEVRASGAKVLLSAGFRNVVPRLWRALRAKKPPLRAIIGISGWAYPRDPELQKDGYGRSYTLGGPYLWSADRSGLPAKSREILERWWAASATSAAQEVALDRDLTFSAKWVLCTHVLPNVKEPTVDAIAAATMALDIPMGDTPSGYGIKFDRERDNQRTYALVMQWQDGKRLAVGPQRFAVAKPDLRGPFPDA